MYNLTVTTHKGSAFEHTHVVECATPETRAAVKAECDRDGHAYRDETPEDKSLPHVNFWNWDPA